MHLMLPLGLAVLLVPSVLLAAFNHRWYQIMALEVLSRDGCGFCILPTWIWETRLTVLGEMATASGESSLGAQIAPQASEDLAVWSSLGNRMVLAVPSHTLSKSCACEPCLKISGRPLTPFLRLTRLLGEEARKDRRPLCWAVPLAPAPVWTASSSRPGGLDFTLVCPLTFSDAFWSLLPSLLVGRPLRAKQSACKRGV